MIPYTITGESITVILNGKSHTTKKGSANFVGLRNALINELWSEVPEHINVAASLQKWAKGKFSIQSDELCFEGKPLPMSIVKRMNRMASRGEDPTSLFNFYERLQKNPSFRSVEQLFDFLDHENIPITEDGTFLAYKGVREDYKDIHSGTFVNTPGSSFFMPRNQISDDPDVPCHVGFHVGAEDYAVNFAGHSGRIVICRVDPEDVVCVPRDHSFQKMRVSKYTVIGNHGSSLPSTTFDPECLDLDDDEEDLSADGDTQDEVSDSDNLDNAGFEELMNTPLDDLRQYATKNLKIVGASKILGGKSALVDKILRTRRM